MENSTKDILRKYIPEEAVEAVYYWLERKKIHLKITKNRTTKLGDYKPPIGYPTHRISINHGLNPYAFLITFVHELAHLIVFEKQGHGVRPHGKEWKTEYRNLMMPFLEKNIFPDTLAALLNKHLQNSKASSSADIKLMRALKAYDNKPHSDKMGTLFLEDITTGSQFLYGKERHFVKMEKRRTRYRCKEIDTGRVFLFHPLAEVIPL